MEFVSSNTAKNILRSHIKEATALTPATPAIKSRVCSFVTRDDARLAKMLLDYYNKFGVWNQFHREERHIVFNGHILRFNENDFGWSLALELHKVLIAKGRVANFTVYNHKIQFYGHALERFYQRAAEIRWQMVHEDLNLAVRFLDYWAYADVDPEYMRIILPTKGGYYIGEIYPSSKASDGTNRYGTRVKTFMQDGRKPHLDELKAKMVKLTNSLKHVRGPNSPEVRGDIVATRMREIIQESPWLFEPYESSELE